MSYSLASAGGLFKDIKASGGLRPAVATGSAGASPSQDHYRVCRRLSVLKKF